MYQIRIAYHWLQQTGEAKPLALVPHHMCKNVHGYIHKQKIHRHRHTQTQTGEWAQREGTREKDGGKRKKIRATVQISFGWFNYGCVFSPSLCPCLCVSLCLLSLHSPLSVRPSVCPSVSLCVSLFTPSLLFPLSLCSLSISPLSFVCLWVCWCGRSTRDGQTDRQTQTGRIVDRGKSREQRRTGQTDRQTDRLYIPGPFAKVKYVYRDSYYSGVTNGSKQTEKNIKEGSRTSTFIWFILPSPALTLPMHSHCTAKFTCI